MKKHYVVTIISVFVFQFLLLISIENILASTTSPSPSSVPSPVMTLEDISNRVIQKLGQQQEKLKTQPKVVYGIVNQIMLPHVDVLTMSRFVLGRDVWRKASVSQRNRFTKEFTDLVIRTYAAALQNYTDERIEFQPLRSEYADQRRVHVKSYIIRNDGPKISVSYRVRLVGKNWKVYDIKVEGVSLVQSFRSQLREELSQSKGDLEQLIQKLVKRNASVK